MEWTDLHTHTTCSDGSDTPEQVVEKAAALGVELMAVADHNSVEGVRVAQRAGQALGVTVLPATEIDVECERGELHLLAYGIDEDDPALRTLLARANKAGYERNLQTMENIERAGYPLRDRVNPDGLAFSQLHVAIRNALIEAGYVRDRDEAYKKFLIHPDFLAPSHKVTMEEVLPVVAAAGGVVSLAHPCKLKIDDEQTVCRLAQLGLWGIEAYYGDGGESYLPRAQALAERYGLYPTIGSDYHGIYRNPGVGMRIPSDAKLQDALALLYARALTLRCPR